MKNLIKKAKNGTLTPSPSRVIGFSSPECKGTRVLCRKVHGFFYALTVMAGVMGSRKARRSFARSTNLLRSVASGLVAFDGGKLTVAKESNP